MDLGPLGTVGYEVALTLMIRPYALKELSKLLGYTFKNSQLLQQALTHRSLHSTHNERLEFLGDAVLGAIIATALFVRYPTESEGALSHMRAALVCEKSLAELAQQFKLSRYVRVGASERGQHMQRRPALLADALEAVIGSIYLDGGWHQCETCILKWYAKHLEAIRYTKPVKDPKTTLQEYLQANDYALPQYQLLSKTGPSHNPLFAVTCRVEGVESNAMSATGSGKNRRTAEQQAAIQLLELLKKNNYAEHVSDFFDEPLGCH